MASPFHARCSLTKLPPANGRCKVAIRCRVRTMNETDLCYTPATELLDAIRAKKLSSVEITAAVLSRIGRLEPKLNAFAYLAAEQAMDAAEAADRALASGEPIGPLHGVPVTIKDHEAVAGMQAENGTYLRKGEVATAANIMLSRFRRARSFLLA